jgi:hypothetical protein
MLLLPLLRSALQWRCNGAAMALLGCRPQTAIALLH